LGNNHIQQLTHAHLLRGSESLGSILNGKSFQSVPSTSDPAPLGNEPYFYGGYNTLRHRSRDNNVPIDAIQIKINQSLRCSSIHRAVFADSLSLRLLEYVNHRYNHQFLTNYCNLIWNNEQHSGIDDL
jgi:hypothetical protein